MSDPVILVTVALAAWRVWHLLALDSGPWDVIDRARRYVTGLPQDWKEGDKIPKTYRRHLAEEFIECPFCMGFWVSLAWAGLYAVDDDWAFWGALPFALNTVVIFGNHALSDE